MELLDNTYTKGDDIIFHYNEKEECLMYDGKEIVSLQDLYVYIQNTRLYLVDLLNGIDLDINEDELEENFHYQLLISINEGEVVIETDYYPCTTSDYLTDHRGCWASTIVDPAYQSSADYYNKEQAKEVMKQLIEESLSNYSVIDYDNNKIHFVEVNVEKVNVSF